MRTTASFRLLTLTLVGLVLAGTSRPASAGSIDEEFIVFGIAMVFTPAPDEIETSSSLDPIIANSGEPEASSAGQSVTYRMTNYNARTEPGEPTLGGVMKKTVWGKLKLKKTSRVVIQTLGGDYDTALAVYTGKKVKKLKNVVANDDFVVAGTTDRPSLVQFTARKGVEYSVQIGSKTGAEGDVYASLSSFPKKGGLTAHLALVGSSPWQGRDYVCQLGPVPNPRCDAPTFLLHNSTNSTVTITASTDLGPAFGVPAPIVLAPGAAAMAAFTVGSVNTTTPRTKAGSFSFVARSGSKVVASAKVRGLVVIKDGASVADVLRAQVTPQAEAGYVNEPKAFKVKLSNIGADAARNCHARSDYAGYVAGRSAIGWRLIKKSGKPIGAADTLFDIPAHKSVWMQVNVASQQSRVADLTLPIPVVPELVIDCQNTSPLVFDQKNKFDVTARGGWRPNQLKVAAVAPRGDTLGVPGTGKAIYRFSVLNDESPAPLIVWPSYVHPFAESDPKQQFSVKICRTKTAKGKCKGRPSSYVEYDAGKRSKGYFRVEVKGPVIDPGFDPTERRVFAIVSQKKPDDFIGTSQPPIAAISIAPKKM